MEALAYLSKDFFVKNLHKCNCGDAVAYIVRDCVPQSKKKHPCDDIAEEPSQMQLRGCS